MISRYTSHDMADIFSPKQGMLYLLEAACLAAQTTDTEFRLEGKLNSEVRRVRDDYKRSIEDDVWHTWTTEWFRLESELDHDVAAFVEFVRARINPDVCEYFHLNRTSSDLSDTALALRITDAQHLVDLARRQLVRNLAVRAISHQATPVVGRTHGQAAEMTTIGRRFALLATQIWSTDLGPYRFGKLTGPVGVNSPAVAENVLKRIGQRQTPSTQIVPRLHLARLMSEIMVATVPLSDLAELIRLGSRRPGGWCAEGKKDGVRGSSSMPTKVNPIRSEKVSGLCKWIRSSAGAVIEGSAGLWEERDISHSSVERLGLPGVFAPLEHAYLTMVGVIRDLVIPPPYDVVEVGPAQALAAIVSKGGATYADAYDVVRQEGPEMALRDFGINPELIRVNYVPHTEAELWNLVNNLSSLRT